MVTLGRWQGGHVSMQRCQTGLKSDGWKDKGWMDTYTRPDRSLSSEAARGHSMQRWLCRRINEKRMMTHFTTSPHTNQEEHCVTHWPLRGNMSPNDQPIMIYWSLQKISPTQSSSEPLPFTFIPRLNQLVDDIFSLFLPLLLQIRTLRMKTLWMEAGPPPLPHPKHPPVAGGR